MDKDILLIVVVFLVVIMACLKFRRFCVCFLKQVWQMDVQKSVIEVKETNVSPIDRLLLEKYGRGSYAL